MQTSLATMKKPVGGVAPERVSTAIGGLDRVLRGGFLRGSLNLVVGPPGSGKTVLGNQIAFGHIARGGRVLYVTHLGETHARMLVHLGTMSFFRPEVIGESLHYLSGVSPLERNSTDGLLEMTTDAMASTKADLLIIDELVTASLFAQTLLSFKRFVHLLQARVAASDCTTVLLASALEPADRMQQEARAVVDGLVVLSEERKGLRTYRELEVQKLRGANQIGGRHLYELAGEGMRLYPRAECLVDPDAVDNAGIAERVTLGIPKADAMLRGGLPFGSSTLVLGAAGSGKTLFGLQYLAEGVRRGERVLSYGFFESPTESRAAMKSMSLPVEDAFRSGNFVMRWWPRRDALLDAVIGALLQDVERLRPTRLLVDGIAAFSHLTTHPGRIGDIIGTLVHALRTFGVTTVWTEETAEPQGPDIKLEVASVSAVAENIILLRCVELPTNLHRLLTMKKVRGSPFDPATYEFTLSEQGFTVSATPESAAALLAREDAATNVPGPRRRTT